jgi:hypothetical protein
MSSNSSRGKVVARIVVDAEAWRLLKVRATLAGKTVAEYVGEILKREVSKSEGEPR